MKKCEFADGPAAVGVLPATHELGGVLKSFFGGLEVVMADAMKEKFELVFSGPGRRHLAWGRRRSVVIKNERKEW